MRWGVGIVATILVSGCASSSSPASDEPVCYEARIDELLKTRTDDPDLLFLRQIRKDLARCSRLADLRPTSLVLASVVNEYISEGVDAENRAEFDRLLQLWIVRDPGNAVPILLKAQLAISAGDLEGGIQTILRASRLPVMRTYELEAQQETWRIMKKEGLDDIALYGAVVARWHYELRKSYLGACGLLTVLAQDHELRRRFEQAQDCIEAEHFLTRRFLDSNPTWLDWSLSGDRGVWTSARLCELSLATGDSEAAGKYANEAREYWRKSKALRLAMQRDIQDNPMVPAFKEAGMWKPSTGEAGGFESIAGILGATPEQWQRFWRALRNRESTIRPYVEEQLLKGNAVTTLERLTPDDHRQLDSVQAPITQFWESRADFYPEAGRPGAGDRLIRWLKLTGTDDYEDAPDFMRERAFHALLRRADKETLAKLRLLLDDKEQENIFGRIAVILVAHGDQGDAVKKQILACVEIEDSAVGWAAGRLGLKTAISALVENLTLEFWPDRFYLRFDEALGAYLALRDLAGQDFGFNSAKWEEWAKREGHLKSDD